MPIHSAEAESAHRFSCTVTTEAGSPLGLFMALRHVSPAGQRGLGTRAAAALMLGAGAAAGDGLPAARRLYNLYHPNDPVAYRCAKGERHLALGCRVRVLKP